MDRRKRWIDANTLLTRKEFLNGLVRGDDMQGITFDAKNLTKELIPLEISVAQASTEIQTLRFILQHPLYQLK